MSLTLPLWLPLLGVLVIAWLPAARSRVAAVIFSLVSSAATLASVLTLQEPRVERYPWIDALSIAFHLRLDGLSALMLLLVAVLSPVAILATNVERQPRLYAALLLLEQAAMAGTFLANDFVLFFICFELTLVPMYFLISIWGSENRQAAAIKFFLYTAAGSAFLLAGGLLLYAQSGTFDISAWQRVAFSPAVQNWAFWLFLLGFAVKIPMLPLHTWLPSAHVQAPTAGSVLLAGVLLKIGGYGLLRFHASLFPRVFQQADVMQLLGILSILAILYGGLVSLMQTDWKRLIAYSSVSHMGFVTLGIFAYSPNSLAGAAIQMVNHGISAAMLFLLFGVIYERVHTREIAVYGGAATPMPAYARVFAFAMFSSAGLPPLNGFVGEFAILQGTFEKHPIWAAWAMLGLVLSAAYLLWLYSRTMLGPTREVLQQVPDLRWNERLLFAPLILWAVSIGIYPKPYFDLLREPIGRTLPALRMEAQR